MPKIDRSTKERRKKDPENVATTGIETGKPRHSIHRLPITLQGLLYRCFHLVKILSLLSFFFLGKKQWEKKEVWDENFSGKKKGEKIRGVRREKNGVEEKKRKGGFFFRGMVWCLGWCLEVGAKLRVVNKNKRKT